MGAVRSLLKGLHELRHLMRKSGVNPEAVKITVEFENDGCHHTVMRELRMDPEFTHCGGDTLANGELNVGGMKVEFRSKARHLVGPLKPSSYYDMEMEKLEELKMMQLRLMMTPYGNSAAFTTTKPRRKPGEDWPSFEVIEAKEGG